MPLSSPISFVSSNQEHWSAPCQEARPSPGGGAGLVRTFLAMATPPPGHRKVRSLVDMVPGDVLEKICLLVSDDDAPCLRLSCKALRMADAKERKAAFKGALFNSVLRAVWAHSNCPPARFVWKPMCWAAMQGSVETLRYLHNVRGFVWETATMHAAARAGHMHTVRWLRENGCNWSEYTCSAAASGGHLEVLQWLRARGCPWDVQTYYAARRRGESSEMFLWVQANGCPHAFSL